MLSLELIGWRATVIGSALVIGPVAAGFMADYAGNHVGGFAMLACGALLGAFLFAGAARPPAPVRHPIRRA